MTLTSPTGYSADVRLELLVNGRCVRLSQVGPDSLILAKPTEIPVGSAELVVTVDGHEHRRRIHLSEGASEASRRVRICSSEDSPNRTIS